MKKTVLLLTVVFAFGVLLNAQNDCTNHTEGAQKTKKLKTTSHLDFNYLSNPSDCSNPEKSVYYTTNRFDVLLSGMKELNSIDAVPGANTIFNRTSGDVNVLPGPHCCTPPPVGHRSQVNPKIIQ